MNTERYGNNQNANRVPKRGDVVISPHGNRVIVSGYNSDTGNVMVGLAIYKPSELVLHTGVR